MQLVDDPSTPSAASPQRDVYSVSRLNREARTLLEGSFPLLWVEGEISNLARPASGHLYFSLKDEAAQVRCAMFRNRNMHLDFVPDNGTQVLIRARISLYEARGEFQIIVEHMEQAGDGALRRAFEALKQRLDKEGLFEAAHKKPVPAWPRCIGVITSASGAAIRDILTTLKRRMPSLPVIVYPVAVQGSGSAEQIVAMLRTAAARAECDVLVLARGGGSLEDLWSFNEESVARAIYECPLPVVTGIGHEVDFTIADFVADQRAATPTAAAELISPNRLDILHRLEQQLGRLTYLHRSQLEHRAQRLQWLQKRLLHPGRQLQQMAQRLDEMQLRLYNNLRHNLRHHEARLLRLQDRLNHRNPIQHLQQNRVQLEGLQQRLAQALGHYLQGCQRRLELNARALDAVSPLATLQRGYAIVSTRPDDKVVYRASQVKPGDQVKARLSQGYLICRVENKHEDEA